MFISPPSLHLSRRAFGELSSRGMLSEYPRLAWNQLEDRAKVSELTLRHELAVLDVKTALSCAIRNVTHYELVEFSTWPLLYQFQAAQPPRSMSNKVIKEPLFLLDNLPRSLDLFAQPHVYNRQSR